MKGRSPIRTVLAPVLATCAVVQIQAAPITVPTADFHGNPAARTDIGADTY